jgi:hypothetical protein
MEKYDIEAVMKAAEQDAEVNYANVIANGLGEICANQVKQFSAFSFLGGVMWERDRVRDLVRKSRKGKP